VKKLVIFGVGLIGGSVALALKQKANAPVCVGVGRNQANLDQALSLSIIDQATTDIASALSGADMVLLAAPVAQTSAILEKIKPHLNSKTIITDAGSTKSDVLATAKTVLGAQAKQFIGGHPIAGSEKTGANAAITDLYQGKHVVLTPTAENSVEDIEKVRHLWVACGANVIEMSAANHDSIFASVSHLPHLLAFALVDDLASRDNAAELFQFAASGFRDFTRIAGSSPEMWRDITMANKYFLIKEINNFQNKLNVIKEILTNNSNHDLEALFKRASNARNDWANSKAKK